MIPAKSCLFIFLTMGLCLFWGCGNNITPGPESATASEAIPPDSLVLILLDKTLSLGDERVQLKFEQPIRSRLVDLIRKKDHQVMVYFIHGNTSGAQAAFKGAITADKPSDQELNELGGQSRTDRKNKYQQDINQQRSQIADKVKEALMAPNPEPTNRQTDLWASLEIMSRAFSTSRPEDKKYVFFVSDMEESVIGANRRDFTRKPPKDKMEAEAWAGQDMEVIKQLYKLQPDVLQGISVTIFLPKAAFEDSGFQTIRYYWEALFGSFGINLGEVRGIELE